MLLEQFSRARRDSQVGHTLWLLPAKCGGSDSSRKHGCFFRFGFPALWSCAWLSAGAWLPSHTHPGRICERSTVSPQSCFLTRKHDCPILLWIQTSIAEHVLNFMTKDKCQMRLYFFSNRAQNIPECRRLQQQMILHKLTSNGHSFRSKPCSVRYLLSVQNGRDLRHPQVHNSSTALAGNNMTINKETWSTLIDTLSPTQSKIGQQPTNRDKIITSNMFARSRNPAALFLLARHMCICEHVGPRGARREHFRWKTPLCARTHPFSRILHAAFDKSSSSADRDPKNTETRHHKGASNRRACVGWRKKRQNVDGRCTNTEPTSHVLSLAVERTRQQRHLASPQSACRVQWTCHGSSFLFIPSDADHPPVA